MCTYVHRAGDVSSATVAHELGQPAAVWLTPTMYVPPAEAPHHDAANAAEHGRIADKGSEPCCWALALDGAS